MEAIVDNSEVYSAMVSEQTTGGKVWDAARVMLQFLDATPKMLANRPTVLELGSGTGWLGMTIACRFELTSMVMTEMLEGQALTWLEHNLARNRSAGLPVHVVSAVALDWGWVNQPGTHGAVLGAHWDIVIGSDLVYNEAGVRMLPQLFAALANPGTRVLYAHTLNRFEFLDEQFLGALRACGLRYTEVWPEPTACTDGQQSSGHGAGDGDFEFSGELFPEMRVVVLLIERDRKEATNSQL